MRIGIMATAALLTAIPASAQAPKDVHGPRTLMPWMVACADTPVLAKPEPRITVKGVRAPDNIFMATRGGEIDLPRSPNDGLDVGQRYAVRRLAGDPKTFPREGEGYGAVSTVGWVTITAIDQYNALANVDFACSPLQPGDYLEAYNEPALPSSATAMVKPDFSDRAAILQGADSKIMFGDGDVLSIERGAAHGVAVGARYAIYRDPRTGIEGMPLFYLADAVVTEVGPTTSKLVVVKAVDAVTTADVAVPRRPTTQQ
jgi:hypothetical protein